MNGFFWNRALLGSLLCFVANPLWAQGVVEPPSKEPVQEREKQAIPEVELSLRSITLHAAGKGWFEYRGTITGP
ncbi:MAG: hypothetical protein ABJ015_02810, partial [Rhodopirellula bahusiensis]